MLEFVLLDQKADAAGHRGIQAHAFAHASCFSVLQVVYFSCCQNEAVEGCLYFFLLVLMRWLLSTWLCTS